MIQNSEATPRHVIIEQMNEPRPLPLGRREFEEWSDRIIAGAMIPNAMGQVFQDGLMHGESHTSAYGEATDISPEGELVEWKIDEAARAAYVKHIESQRFALAGALLHIGPTESHKPDAHFIHQLRVMAVKQVAVAMGEQIKAQRNARAAMEAEEQEKAAEHDEYLDRDMKRRIC